MEKTLLDSTTHYKDYSVVLLGSETHFVPGTTKRVFRGPGELLVREWMDGTTDIIESSMDPRLK